MPRLCFTHMVSLTDRRVRTIPIPRNTVENALKLQNLSSCLYRNILITLTEISDEGKTANWFSLQTSHYLKTNINVTLEITQHQFYTVYEYTQNFKHKGVKSKQNLQRKLSVYTNKQQGRKWAEIKYERATKRVRQTQVTLCIAQWDCRRAIPDPFY